MGFFLEKSLHGEANTSLFVGFDHLDAHLLAFLQIVGNLVDAFVGDLADMKETVLAGEQLNDGAEVEQTLDRAFVDLTDFDFGRDELDATAGLFDAGRIGARDRDRAVVFDIDRRAGFFRQSADRGAALADPVADLFPFVCFCKALHWDNEPGGQSVSAFEKKYLF